MAANIKETREEGTIRVTNIATAKAAGKLIVVGELVCCHKEAQGISALNCPVWVDGVEIEYAKLTTDVVTEGAILYYNSATDELNLTAAALKKAGIAAAAAGNGVTTARCHLGLIR